MRLYSTWYMLAGQSLILAILSFLEDLRFWTLVFAIAFGACYARAKELDERSHEEAE